MESIDCCNNLTKPSGHAGHYEPLSNCCYATPRRVNFNLGEEQGSDVEECLPEDFSGPYKKFNPPGDRTPAVGEKEWGDVPYLPSYLDKAHPQNFRPSGAPDNLYSRGPFYKGVSETHEEFINRGGIEPKKYHTFVRHYEEPGLKYDKSISQTDFCPPYPMTTREPKDPYVPKQPRIKNPHLKVVDCKSVDPKIVYIDDEPKRVICCQRAKPKILLDYIPPPEEIFQRHVECPIGIPCYSTIDLTPTLKDLCAIVDCPQERQIRIQENAEEKLISDNKFPSNNVLCHCKSN